MKPKYGNIWDKKRIFAEPLQPKKVDEKLKKPKTPPKPPPKYNRKGNLLNQDHPLHYNAKNESKKKIHRKNKPKPKYPSGY